MYQRILAPTDGSDVETPALLAAVMLAERFAAELHLVRVETPPMVVDTLHQQAVLKITEETLREARAERVRKLEDLAAKLRDARSVRIVTVLQTGQVAPVLQEYVEQNAIDLVVMSSHSRGGLKRIVLGSVTDYLSRHTNVPVLVVKPTGAVIAAGNTLFSTIVVPLDGSADAEQILPGVTVLAKKLGATVNLVHVLTPVTYSQHEVMQPGLPWWDQDIANADSYLSRALSYLSRNGVTANKYVLLSEDISAALLDYAARIKADLVAIATSGTGGIKRFVLGSIADEVTRRVACSVLVFHPKPALENALGKQARERVTAGG